MPRGRLSRRTVRRERCRQICEDVPVLSGNETKTSPEVMCHPTDGGPWQVRVIPNKFAALASDVQPVRSSRTSILSRWKSSHRRRRLPRTSSRCATWRALATSQNWNFQTWRGFWGRCWPRSMGLESPDLSFHDSQRSGGICPALEASGYCQTALRGENSNAFVPSCFQETRCTQTQ